MRYYINFYFRNIVYDDGFYGGQFLAPDVDVSCQFMYDRKTKEFLVWDNSKPVEEILPIPVRWLDWKLEENGFLRENESKISY